MESGDLYGKIAELGREGKSFVIATIVEAVGSTPRKLGAKMLVLPDGSTMDTIGGGKIEHQIIRDALDCIRHGTSRMVAYELRETGEHALGMLCGGDTKVFLDVHVPGKTLVIVGAGHIAQKLSPMAKLLDFGVIVLDSREEYATQEKFPEADQVICHHPAQTADVVPLSANSYVVIVTHGHVHDKDALRSVINSPVPYIGMIGSRQKVRAVLSDLAAEGVDSNLLARVHSPVGLDLGGQAPAEISVSILAEIIADSNGRLNAARAQLSSVERSHPAASVCHGDVK